MSKHRKPPEPRSRPSEPAHVPATLGATHTASFDLAEALVMLRRNDRLILGVTVAIVLLVAWLLHYDRAVYQSSAALRLADARLAVAGGFEQAQAEVETDPFLSEMEVLRSRTLAGDVVDAEGLRLQPLEQDPEVAGVLHDVHVAPDLPPDTLQLRFSATSVALLGPHGTVQAVYGTPLESPDGRLRLTVTAPITDVSAELHVLPRESAIDQLLDNLIVSPREPTNIIDLHYTAVAPGTARRVLDRITTTFQAANAERAQQRSRRRREFLEVQITRTDSILVERQLSLSQFRGRQGLYSTRDRLQAAQANLTDVEMRRRELRAEVGMYRSLLERLDRAGPSETDERLRTLLGSPGIVSNPVLGELYAHLLEYEREREALTTGRWASSPDHPDVLRLSSLIVSTESRITSAIRSHLTGLDARIASLGDVEARSTQDVQALPQMEAEEVRLVQQVETVRRMGDRLREDFQAAQIAEAVEVGQVEILDAATLPLEPANLSRTLKLGFALLLGLLLGGGAAVTRELLDPTVRQHGEIARSFNLPQLAVIPRITHADAVAASPRRLLGPGRSISQTAVLHRATVSPQLAAATHLPRTGSPADEAFRSLRTNLMFSAQTYGARTMIVTSAFPQEGKSVTASSLAAAFAHQGVRTLLVDCDLRRPKLHELFGVPQEPGLTDLLAGRVQRGEAVRKTAVPRLSLLTAGAIPHNPTELLGGGRMRSLVRKLPEGIDLLIADTPPLLAAADAAALAVKVDAVLLVVRAGRTARGALQQAVDQLEAIGARIGGVILNDPEREVSRYGDYYSAYGYYTVEPEAVSVSGSR